jgi:hypothetical protein
MSGKLLKRSKSSSRRRSKKWKNKNRNVAARPAPSRIPADEEGNGRTPSVFPRALARTVSTRDHFAGENHPMGRPFSIIARAQLEPICSLGLSVLLNATMKRQQPWSLARSIVGGRESRVFNFCLKRRLRAQWLSSPRSGRMSVAR